MSDMFDKVVDQQDIFKKLLSKIPGFSGYIERENRRSADKVVRETVASRFEAVWKRISALQTDLVKSGDLKSVGDLESAALKFRQFIDRVEKASYGYSGFFDAVKINQKELSAVYTYDLSMLDLVDQATGAVDNVERSIGTDGLPASIRALVTVAETCVSTFDKRVEVITGMGVSQ